MTDALATPSLWWLLLGAFLAGGVRGFSGFGTAMIYLPFAATVVSPVQALISLVVMDSIGPLPAVPRALRDVSRRHLALLLGGAVVFLPVGLMLLTLMEPETYRWVIGCVTLVAVALMASGWRLRNAPSAPLLAGAGAAGGFLGGAAGLPGPPVILVTMASPLGPAAIRATTLLYLLVIDILFLPILAFAGHFSLTAVVIGAVAILPYVAGVMIGSRLFDPEKERAYRAVAYGVIATSALMALPVWG